MDKIKIYQIDVKVYLLKTITYHDMQQQITQFLDQYLARKEELLQFHQKNCFKKYCFSGWKQFEKSGVYPEGSLNSFSIRCLEEDFARELAEGLAHHESMQIKGLSAQVKEVRPEHIRKLYAITPVIVRFEEGGYWRKNHSLEEFQERILSNVVRKYQDYTGETLEMEKPFYYHFQMLNRVPIKTRYKNISLLGDKFEVMVAEDPMSQQIARLLCAAAVGELSARGFGYVGYRS